jgi:CheY-like chemotaxis protein
MNQEESWVGVVEDDASLRVALARALHANGIRVKTFGSAEDFLHRSVHGEPECIVLDIHLPGMSGFELQDILAVQDVAPPIIFITGHEEMFSRHGRESRSAGYLRKPFDTTELVALLRPHLRSSALDGFFVRESTSRRCVVAPSDLRRSTMPHSNLRRSPAAAFWPLVLSALIGSARPARSQGLTSATIAGRIVGDDGHGLSGVEVVVANDATGISMRGVSREDGRYFVAGLDVGGPYSVTVRRIGSAPKTRSGLFLSLGQQLSVDLSLEQQPVTLQGMETKTVQDRTFSRAHMGTTAFLSDSLIHQMPVINRDLYDLGRLVPQMSTWFALTPSGAGTRGNDIRIDGLGDQVPSSNLAAGQLYGGRVIPLDAVKEFQVSLSPYDVRQGGFAGASVNVVTRGGTNDLHGTVFGYGTNEKLGADVPFVRNSRYEKDQFGFSLGGPIVRDHLLFFAASEIQQRLIPAIGPYVGQSSTDAGTLPVSPADIARFQHLLGTYGLDGGSAGAVTNRNPSSSSVFRLDAPISRWNSRVTIRGNYGYADSSIFARPTTLAPTDCATTACFPLSSLQHSRWVDKRSVAVELVSNFGGGANNELLAGYLNLVSGFRPSVDQPLILVTVPGTGGMPAVLQSGTHEIATGQRNASRTAELTDNFSIPLGPHQITAGVSTQLFDMRAFQLRGSYGIWEFGSLDSLQSGAVSHYRVTRDTGSVTAASGAYPAFYVGDQWDASSSLSLSLGIRADIPVLSAHPPYVAGVDSVFHVRTDAVPSSQVQWSPRIGFNYSLTERGETRAQIRGGVGVFTGRPPMFWLFGGFSAYGLATRTLQCGSLASDAGAAPVFHPDYRDPPLACAGGQTFGPATNGEIDVIDPHLRLPQTMRASLAIDAPLLFGAVGTIEGLYTRSSQSVFYGPLNLGTSTSFDHDGRQMYGSISATGFATPARVASQYGDIVSITNQSRDHAYDVTSGLHKQSRVADADVSLSYGRSYDVQSTRPLSALLTDNWRFGRPVIGAQNDLSLGTSDFDQPVRVRASGTLYSPWRTFRTELSFFYVGGSGFPFTYVAGGTQGRGDLNADGAVGNDPIYIPRSAFDTAQIKFGGSAADVAAQRAAFDRFVDGAACLRNQRGRIMSRNSCRSPWMSMTNLAVRQTLPSVRGQSLTLEAQIFNVLNLLNPRWGRLDVPTGAVLASTNQIALLSQVGETLGPRPQPVFQFDTSTSRYTHDSLDSYYQIQFALHYHF